MTVVLDTNLTEELIREGYAREVISKLQTMRKDAGFEVTDRIHVAFEADDELAAVLESYADMICKATLTTDIARRSAAEGEVSKAWDINGKQAVLSIARN